MWETCFNLVLISLFFLLNTGIGADIIHFPFKGTVLKPSNFNSQTKTCTVCTVTGT